jgi:hypothetical protein
MITDNENPTKKVLEKLEQEFQKYLIEDIPRDQMVSSIMTS